MIITKKNKIKNKITKKILNGGSKKFLLLVQHNIGSIEYEIKKKIYFKDYNTNLVKNKKYKKSPYRDFVNYFYLNKCVNENTDLFFLQEVQYGDKNFTNYDYKYYINYNITGFLDICDETEKKKSVIRVPHGCLIGYNQEKFEFINGLKSFNLGNNYRKKYRTSDWLIIKQKKNKNIYAILSVHGPICNPLNEEKIELYKNFYKSLMISITKIKNKFKKVKFIITGDFNINLLKPKINPFIVKRTKKEINIEKIQMNIIDIFKKFINDENMTIIDNSVETNFNRSYKETLDFIIVSNELKSKLDIHIKNYNTNTKVLELGNFEYLFNDFDHSKLIGTLKY